MDRLKASGESKAAVTARTKVGGVKFGECGDLFHEKKFLLKMKGKSLLELCKVGYTVQEQTWCLREIEMAILRRTEKPIMKALCGIKMI